MPNPLENVNPCAEVLSDNALDAICEAYMDTEHTPAEPGVDPNYPVPVADYMDAVRSRGESISQLRPYQEGEALLRYQQTVQAGREISEEIVHIYQDQMQDRLRPFADYYSVRELERSRRFGRELLEAPSISTPNREQRAKVAAGQYMRSKYGSPTDTITALEAIDLLADFHVHMQVGLPPARISARYDPYYSDPRDREIQRREEEILYLRRQVFQLNRQLNQRVPEPKPAEIAVKVIEGEGRQFRHELYEEPA